MLSADSDTVDPVGNAILSVASIVLNAPISLPPVTDPPASAPKFGPKIAAPR